MYISILSNIKTLGGKTMTKEYHDEDGNTLVVKEKKGGYMKWVLIILFALLAAYFTNSESVEKLFSRQETARVENVEDSSIAEENWAYYQT